MSFAQSEMKLCEFVRFYFISKLREHGFLLTCVHGRLVQLLRLLSRLLKIQQRSYPHVLIMKRITIAQFGMHSMHVTRAKCIPVIILPTTILADDNVGCMM